MIGTTQAARKLGVRYLLDGSIRRAAGRLRITVQLIDGFADHQIWAERYDLDSGDDFIMQDEICAQVLGRGRAAALSGRAFSHATQIARELERLGMHCARPVPDEQPRPAQRRGGACALA